MDLFPIAKKIAEEARNRREAEGIKRKISKELKLSRFPSNAEILKSAEGTDIYPKLKEILRVKPVRTVSGVAVVSVMSSPANCPHGKCVPCPGGVEFGTPQSYTGLEPAAMRGIQYSFDPFKQVFNRLLELESLGHDVSKVEVIVMGGTFIARDKEYRDSFILNIYNALNIYKKKIDLSKSLEEAKSKNEHAFARCVGLTFETRPDYAREEHISEMLFYGGTKVELGVQSIYDDVLEKIERGHRVSETIEATRLLKDFAFKVGYHLMPGLPGSNFEKDLKMFKEIFENENFKPDYLKIYPTLVIKGTKLYEMWKKGEYEPYTTEEVVELIAKAKKFFPEWVRVQRVQRDIPVKVAIGLEKGNIRQLVKERLKDLGYSCRCIRCREVGHKGVPIEEYKRAELFVRKYKASKGEEYFISFEIPDFDALIGFVRLRFPYKTSIENCALIRELHVYGKAVGIGLESDAFQHRGFGERLLAEAENIAKEKYDEVAVISGVGARPYYRKFGYEKIGEYMVKKLNR
ncbi:MAG: tRNA uridine(34) 5-carboxymethylaminomethyl modification radical SAM/GNAT enzyme Elp3 [Archaeoglobaceae archaeon]|nr:tRNA uridine(34) 5-carboxymethylaminomethyl modification radical SAM/GNAT enzyme Elp3 [Archaeoglobaceae archaeon]MCX8152120.1 tRNA uridine(34) 5-carboxymethylaminomethyl modification radical SAM/GNAT enzyme Elp3 [Archaeoglobaceae archaeon]MDW8013556.1 tRNA uridine(34) 5-carboxymethylaminomethyl modification radical SAM/GNAT enzyme Elp3 [Archaeoglobaceae archaeon]